MPRQLINLLSICRLTTKVSTLNILRPLKNTYRQGFIALVSVIILTTVLTIIIISQSSNSFLTRFNLLDTENKALSLELALACLETAKLKITRDYWYAGGDTVETAGQNCQILSVSPTGNDWPKTITLQAKPKNYYTNLQIRVDENLMIL